MRRLSLLMAAMAACAILTPGRPRPAGAAQGTSWPAIRPSGNQWVQIETEVMLDHPGGASEVLAVCRAGKSTGYNGLVLWDSNLWERDLPPGYMENARTLIAGLRELGFTLMVKMAPRGYANVRWSKDETMCEPRPANPHPEEKDYRYLCLAHPGILQVWEEQLRRAEEIYHPAGWLLQYDEIRVAGTDARCRASGKSPGQLLRENAQKAVTMFRRVTPGRTVAVWSDMFDPYFNATARKYYHVEGSLAAAAGAVDSQVLIFSWNDKPISYGYWANRGNKQIVPLYFDHDDLTPKQETDLLRQAQRYRGSFIGWSYATWRRNYAEVELYGNRYPGGMAGGGGGGDERPRDRSRPRRLGALVPQLGFQL